MSRSSAKARCPLPGETVVLGAWGMARAGDVRGERVRWRWLAGWGLGCCAGVESGEPLRLLGVIWGRWRWWGEVRSSCPRPTTWPRSLRFLLSALVVCGLRERLGRELVLSRSVAETAQRVLLRPPPRRIVSWRVAWLYLTAENEARIGGGLFAIARAAHPLTREAGAFRRCPSVGPGTRRAVSRDRAAAQIRGTMEALRGAGDTGHSLKPAQGACRAGRRRECLDEDSRSLRCRG